MADKALAQATASGLNELIAQIIALSRLQSTDPLLAAVPIEVDDVIDDVLDQARALADNRARLDYAVRLSGVGFWHCDLPFDELKIDRGFVTGARKLPARRAIFCGCIDMAHELHIRVVAEGVEDREDWDFVRTSGCDQAQGDFISRPIPAADLPAWHGRWQQRCGELLG